MPPALTPEAARAQADALRIFARLPEDPRLAGVIRATVLNPAASADTLLILAEALRETWHPALLTLADDLAALAPTRANPAPRDTATQEP